VIVTVTLNVALDVTYPVPTLEVGGSHVVGTPHARAGGKGVNVARVLHQHGCPVLATGLVGGPTGADVRDDLAAAGVAHDFAEVAGPSRRTVTVVAADSGDATAFNEPGPEVSAAEWGAFVRHLESLLAEASVVVLSGSLPGVPVYAYRELTRLAQRHGTAVVLDATQVALLAALEAGPDIVKPNASELAATTGLTSPVEGAGQLRDRGARAVVASLGVDGLLAHTPDGLWRASIPERLAGNPTGAGDACVAALAAGIAEGWAWPQRLRTAVAWSAAAVVAPHAGTVDPDTRDRVHDHILVEEIHAADVHR